jgi:endogenous inhibitor of DNA gyrase (YacG/DUF329 family)
MTNKKISFILSEVFSLLRVDYIRITMKLRCPICGRKLKMPRPKPGKDGTGPPACRLPAGARRGREFSPFCSERCKLLDLGAWLNGQYRIVEPNSSREEKDGED